MPYYNRDPKGDHNFNNHPFKGLIRVQNLPRDCRVLCWVYAGIWADCPSGLKASELHARSYCFWVIYSCSTETLVTQDVSKGINDYND